MTDVKRDERMMEYGVVGRVRDDDSTLAGLPKTRGREEVRRKSTTGDGEWGWYGSSGEVDRCRWGDTVGRRTSPLRRDRRRVTRVRRSLSL